MYQEWRVREDKIAMKRREMQIEEDKLKKMAFVSGEQVPQRSAR
jgi:hypothetical protein